MNLYRHTRYLKDVLIYTLSAFGGPQAHVGLMTKYFVNKRNYVTEKELLEYYAFCQLLPGASSTQLLGIIGLKRGGVILSILTLLLWILPAWILMTFFSLWITDDDINQHLLRFIPSMTAGFLIYAAVNAIKHSIRNTITLIIFISSCIASFIFFTKPWIFPVLILLGGVVTNFSKKRIPETESIKPKQIKWTNILVFGIVFIIAGILSEASRKQQWDERKQYNLFENFYRFGSFVFGGGDVLLPMMLDQYVARPSDPHVQKKNPNVIRMEKKEILTGFGLVRAIPGPVFSVSAYCGAMVFKEGTIAQKIKGSTIATIAIFLPSILLMFFFFPVWHNLKKYVIVYRSLEGIHAVATGIILSGLFYLLQAISFSGFDTALWVEVFVVTSTFFMLQFTKIPAPFIVLFTFSLGYLL